MSTTTADGNGIILLDWLRLLGWGVEIEHEDDTWVGVARHVEGHGAELRVGACANGLSKLAWQLFIGAMEQLEGGRDRFLHGALRAA